MTSQADEAESWGAPTLESTMGKPQWGAQKFSFLKVLDGERNWVQEDTDTDTQITGEYINNLLEKLLVPLRNSPYGRNGVSIPFWGWGAFASTSLQPDSLVTIQEIREQALEPPTATLLFLSS